MRAGCERRNQWAAAVPNSRQLAERLRAHARLYRHVAEQRLYRHVAEQRLYRHVAEQMWSETRAEELIRLAVECVRAAETADATAAKNKPDAA
jgi:hypothetical protein